MDVYSVVGSRIKFYFCGKHGFQKATHVLGIKSDLELQD